MVEATRNDDDYDLDSSEQEVDKQSSEAERASNHSADDDQFHECVEPVLKSMEASLETKAEAA